jgi:mono/diheme cytochrome c family protein
MKIKITAMTSVLAFLTVLYGTAQPPKKQRSSAPVVYTSTESDAMRIEGERRFRANCSRCHAAPHKFPPRMMSTIVRHMRVRATITDEDMRRILYYMSQ